MREQDRNAVSETLAQTLCDFACGDIIVEELEYILPRTEHIIAFRRGIGHKFKYEELFKLLRDIKNTLFDF